MEHNQRNALQRILQIRRDSRLDSDEESGNGQLQRLRLRHLQGESVGGERRSCWLAQGRRQDRGRQAVQSAPGRPAKEYQTKGGQLQSICRRVAAWGHRRADKAVLCQIRACK